MTVEIVEVNSCKKSLAVEVPADEVERELENVARQYARDVKVPGFRPGKVPLNIVRQRFGNDLRKDATQKIIERCWKDAMTEHDLKPISEPVVENMENKPGDPLKFTVSFEVLPALEIKDYKGLSVAVPPSEITDEDVNKALDSIREQHAQFAPAEGAEAKDDHYLTLTVDYQVGDTEKVHQDDVLAVIGHQAADTEFNERLRGARAGETRTFEIEYPEDSPRKRFAGSKVGYTVAVKEIREKLLPELNDEFAKDVGSDNLEALRTKVRDEMVTHAKQAAEKKAREMLLDTLVERQSVDVPQCMVQDELESHINRIASNLAYQGISVNQTSIDWKKVFDEERPHAEQAVRRTLVLEAIARQEGIEATADEVDSELQKLVEGTNKSAAALRAQLEKEERIQSLERHLRQNKALDFIYRNANISVG